MNKLNSGLLALAMCGMVMLSSCTKVDQPTYTETFFRLATVEKTSYGVNLNIDYTGESFTLNNFRLDSDIDAFKVRPDNRVLAAIEVKMVGSADLSQFLVNTMDTLQVMSLNLSSFQDSVGPYFNFANLQVDNSFLYPKLWTNGKYLNVAPFFCVKGAQDAKKGQFRLFPNRVSNDTLYLTMRLDSISCDTRYSKENRYYCYDLSSMKRSTSNAEMKQRVNDIYSKLRALRQDSIYITVESSKVLISEENDKQNRNNRVSVTTKSSFCF